MPVPYTVIVIPGVTATYLRDLYPLPPETIWAVMHKDFERSQMHPDNTRYEAAQPAMTRPDQLYEIAYKELIEELRYNLCESVDKPVPVYPFGYDWRHPLDITEEALADFIDEVIDRTKLLRHYAKDGYGEAPKVNLVGHSMGGLVVAGYVERFGTGKINKIATLATPYKGSFEAMVKMATGTANIGGTVPSSREREAARLTPSLYHLLPSFKTGSRLHQTPACRNQPSRRSWGNPRSSRRSWPISIVTQSIGRAQNPAGPNRERICSRSCWARPRVTASGSIIWTFPTRVSIPTVGSALSAPGPRRGRAWR